MKHQAELTWYFSAGQCAFERSVFGSMLDRAANMAHGSKVCEACGGTGYAASEASAEELVRGGSDSTSPRLCRPCRGRGSFPDRKHGRYAPRWQALAPAVVARGAGLTIIDARPIHGARTEPSYTPNDESMRRFARVSRKLRMLTAGQVEVLARYYGDIGASWVLTPTGRIGSVYPMTAHGRALISEWLAGRPEAEAFLRSDEVVRTIAAVNRRTTNPDDKIRKRLHKADDEARALLANAQENWRALR